MKIPNLHNFQAANMQNFAICSADYGDNFAMCIVSLLSISPYINQPMPEQTATFRSNPL